MPRFPRQLRLPLCLGLAIILPGCASRIRPVEPPPPIDRGYVDLQPGWRLRVVTPVLKSGKYKADFKETAARGGGVQLEVGDDFVGYETSYYEVGAATSGVVVRFTSAKVTVNGGESPRPQPLVRLFDLPASTRHVRLVFLTRISRADHNQAILAAAKLDELNRLTSDVRADPTANCRSQSESYCEWVPEGIAVRAERRDPANRKNWIPAL